MLPIEKVKPRCNPHWFNRQQFLCSECHQSIAWQISQFPLEFPQNFHHIDTLQGLASTFYTYPIDTVIRQFKNQHELNQLPILIHLLRQLDLPKGCHANNSLIIPMPTTLSRLKNRGFDPITMLASYLSFHWQVPIFPYIKREERQKQQGLSKAERLRNTAGVFHLSVSPSMLPAIKHIIVFDDVATTGATLQSLCQTILATIPVQQNITLHARALVHGNP